MKWFGFVAPGLTVLPYAFMSGLNLIANLVTPHYPTMYLVRSEVMEEAERRAGYRFDYVVGEIVDESGTDDDGRSGSEIAGTFKDDDEVLYVTPEADHWRLSTAERHQKINISNGSTNQTVQPVQTIYVPSCPKFLRTDNTRYVAPSMLRSICELSLVTLIFGVEILIALALSNFSGQHSTFAQRFWIVTWVTAGYCFGVMTYLWSFYKVTDKLERGDVFRWLRVFVYIVIGVIISLFGLAGFVVVSQMLIAYGICYNSV